MDMQLEGGDRSNGLMVYVAVGVAIVGVIAGIIGAVRGASASRIAGTLDERLKDVERRLGDTASGTEQLVNQMNSFVKGANQTLADFGQRISKVERDVKALGEKPVATTPTAPARGSTGPVASSDRGETAPSGRVYEVKAGDTMEKIARQTNVSLADLLRLNPQVEPTRMKVGTKLNLP